MKKNQDKEPQPFNIKTYPFLQCRERHDWYLYDGNVDEKAGIAVKVQKCSNCSMKKVTTMSLHKHAPGRYLRSPRYVAPEGYRVLHGLSTYDRGAIRLHNFLADFKGKG